MLKFAKRDIIDTLLTARRSVFVVVLTADPSFQYCNPVLCFQQICIQNVYEIGAFSEWDMLGISEIHFDRRECETYILALSFLQLHWDLGIVSMMISAGIIFYADFQLSAIIRHSIPNHWNNFLTFVLSLSPWSRFISFPYCVEILFIALHGFPDDVH